MEPLLRDPGQPALAELITLGLHHEQQHQELLLMDIKHVLSRNPLHPAYLAGSPTPSGTHPPKASWFEHGGGPVEVGHRGEGFGFDNEFPVHTVHLEPVRARRPAGDLRGVALLHGGRRVQPAGVLALRRVGRGEHPALGGPPVLVEGPRRPRRWLQFTLAGLRPVDPDEPVCHVSYYEADAFAHWTGMRLPTESEWETIGGSAR